EFDLNGNGVKGEADADEVGAWIIVNSWGGWCNGGFIYCPYAKATPAKGNTGYYKPEYYTARRDYRPLRTLKVLMDYSHRSEIALYVGVAQDLNATKPEKETFLRHFYYSGLGKGATADPAPEVPMLGKWADGMHYEPMEFGYDLTDLTEGFDLSRPLKYFFWTESKSFAVGEGHIYAASIIDYTLDRDGIETPFSIPEGGTQVLNAGKVTTISTVGRSENVKAPRNLCLTDGTLTWEAPAASSYDVKKYQIYKDNDLYTSVEGNALSLKVAGEGSFAVTALYDINGYEVESAKSAAIANYNAASLTTNSVLEIAKGGTFTLPSVTTGNLSAYTIEFFMYPSVALINNTFGIKASSGKFFAKINAAHKFEIGYDGGDYTTVNKNIVTRVWTHVAIVVDGTRMSCYINGARVTNWTSGYSNSGLGGNNDLIFGQTEGTTTNYKELLSAPWTGQIDEVRFWNVARTAAEIKASYKETYVYPLLQANLTHYYKMDPAQGCLVDAMGRHDATLSDPSFFTYVEKEAGERTNPLSPAASADFELSDDNVVVGQPLTIIDQSSPSTVAWDWTVTGTDSKQLKVARPVVIFNEAGEQTIGLKTTNLDGTVSEASKTITVSAATKPVADFDLPSGDIAAGDHVTFVNTTTPIDACSYRWELTGADIEDVRTTNAAATYAAYGKYKVKLTASNAAGSSSVEKEIEVKKVAPQSAFRVKNNVILAGEKVYLVDQSRYDPSAWTWNVSSSAKTFIIQGQTSSLTIDKPGIYDVSLKASNDIGSNEAVRARAITVCNADGQNGLKFDALDDEVVLGASPLGAARAFRLSAEWWMYPGVLTESCLQIGDEESTFLLRTTTDGSMTLYAGGKSCSSVAGYVIDNEWHHYGVVFSSGTVTFYRDGVSFGTAKPGSTYIPVMSNFRLGGTDGPMNAIVDEFRVWKIALTQNQLRTYANAPLEAPASESNLLVYYDFNQSSGNVIDKSSQQLNGQRNNFGPDGDAWTDSKGIFFLNFENTGKDVTATYLKNYKSSFTAGSGYVNGTARFRKLGTPWVQENSVVENDVTTEFHVDTQKNNCLTLSLTWDGFAAEVSDLKLYQTVELPAGAYELKANSGTYEWNPSGIHLAVAEGEGLPGSSELDSQSLGYALCGNTCNFYLPEAAKVSVGLVATKSGKSCHTIKSFSLVQKDLTVIDADMNDAVEELPAELSASSTLQAAGGLGVIRLVVGTPQRVDIFDMGGRLVWSEFVEANANVPVRKGIYLVGQQKVMVR
nr:DUF5013 domain-containing protein [Bacteroidaceae bacterium]